MKYFMDTHDRAKGTFPAQAISQQDFLGHFKAMEKAAEEFHVVAHAAHVNLEEGKAFCLMSGPDEVSVRKAHEAIHLPYDSITEIKRVTGADLRSVPDEASH